MSTVSYKTRLSNWFHIRFFRADYAAMYPPVGHRRRRLFSSCISIKQKPTSSSSIRGCASCARYDSYTEGENDDC